MAQYANHGGSCCGMRHIFNFRDDERTNIRSLIENLNTLGADNRLQQEVILSNRQTTEYPGLVDELARLGFVYTSSWTGQHGTPVHLFLRAKMRLALSEANFYERWTQAGGMLPHPALAGSLPIWREQVRPRVVQQHQRPGAYQYNNYLVVGDRVRVNSPNSRLHDTEQTISGFRTTDNYYSAATFAGVENHLRISVNNLTLIPAAAPAAPPPAPAPIAYRHPNAANVAFAAPRENVPVPPVPARRLILSQFYCVFRNTGQPSRVFATLAAGQEAYPRATQWFERKVYSDGEIVEGAVNHG